MSFPIVGREMVTEVELEICEAKYQKGLMRDVKGKHTLTTIAAVHVMTMKMERMRLRWTSCCLAFSRLRS
jgi:hypothetical protein